MIIDSQTVPPYCEVYDEKGNLISGMIMVDTDTMVGQKLIYLNSGSPPKWGALTVDVWVVIWDGLRFERDEPRQRQSGRVINTGHKVP